MPIRELSERPNIPRLGKIRLGDKDPQRGFPINRPYFVVPEEVAAALGEAQPTELRIVFLTDDQERNASQYYRAYNASSGLICRGDGYHAEALLDGDVMEATGELGINSWAHGNTRSDVPATKNFIRQQINCAGSGYDGEPACPMFATKKCAVRSFMQFAIRDVPGLGVYQLDTGSVINIRNINGTIEMAKMMLGGVAGVPMILRRTQLSVTPDGIQKKVWGVELVVDTGYSLANLIALRSQPVATVLLPPVDETEVYDAAQDETREPETTPDGREYVPTPNQLPRGVVQDEEKAANEAYDRLTLQTPVAVAESPPAAPSEPQQPSEPIVPPSVLLNQLAKKGPALVLAANVAIEDHYPYIKMPNGGRALTALTLEDRASVSQLLRDWVAERAEPHPLDLTYDADGNAFCAKCEKRVPDPTEPTT